LPRYCSSFAGISPAQWSDWRWQYKNRIRSLSQLVAWGESSPNGIRDQRQVIRSYPLSITPYYLSLIDCKNDGDPIRRQCFPDLREVQFSLGGEEDPLAEGRQMPVPGLVHRYSDRCLILATHACSVYCRHCNRKRLWRHKQPTASPSYFQPMLDYISRSRLIREVILSGGDPLTLPDKTLDWLLSSLRTIPHVDVIRIGTRMPVVLPMRITRELCELLRRYRPLWLNTQFNHPREITFEAAAACERLLSAGIPVSNQSVLLKGVNDDYETMRDLLYGLQKISVRPYYLFQCDQVKGTDHFRVDIWKGMEMMERLWCHVSGLCLPRYVLDVPGASGKIPLQPFSLQSGPHIPKA
jgi:lysine 2,3-aminomutase